MNAFICQASVAPAHDMFMKPYILLTLLVALVFSNSLTFSFIKGDDYAFIVNNSKIDLPLSELPSLFTTPLWESIGITDGLQVYYRPVGYLFYVINYKIWGLNPMGYHLSKVLFHLSCVFLLYKCAMLLFDRNIAVSIMAASLFAVHPVNSQTISWLSAADSTYGFFALLTIYLFVRNNLWLSLVAYVFALLSKETAVMLPLALLMFAVYEKGFKKGTTSLLPFALATVSFLVVRGMIVESFFGDSADQPPSTRFLTMAVASFDYLRLLVFPYPLNPIYPERWYPSVVAPKVLVSLAGLGLFIWLVFRLRGNSLRQVLLVVPLIMLGPAILKVNTFPIRSGYEYICERYLYVPSMFFSLFAASFAAGYIGVKEKRRMMMTWLVIVAVFSLVTFTANNVWKNSIVFYSFVLKRTPGVALAHTNLGNAYVDEGRIDEAIQEYRAALKIKDYANAHFNLGTAYYLKGDAEEAIREYEAALRLNPDDEATKKNLRIVYEMKKYIDSATQADGWADKQ